MRDLFVIMLFSTLLSGCSGKQSDVTRLNLPFDSMINYSSHLINFLSTGDKTLLFVYDGNCGYCVNKVRLCDSLYLANRRDYGQHNCLAILNTRDKYILEYHLEKLDISIPVFIDTGSFFLTSNHITQNNICFVLDSCNRVVYQGDYLKSTRKVSRAMKGIDKNEW